MSVASSRRKYADRTRWLQVLERHFSVRRVEETEFSGYVTRLDILAVREPLFKKTLGKTLCLADAGYTWLQHFPDGARYCVTTMLDDRRKVVRWYIDIADSLGLSEEHVPWWDDVYLDIVVVPKLGAEVVDEDDLEQGLAEGAIDEEAASLARQEAERIKMLIDNSEFPLLALTPTHLELF